MVQTPPQRLEALRTEQKRLISDVKFFQAEIESASRKGVRSRPAEAQVRELGRKADEIKFTIGDLERSISVGEARGLTPRQTLEEFGRRADIRRVAQKTALAQALARERARERIAKAKVPKVVIKKIPPVKIETRQRAQRILEQSGIEKGVIFLKRQEIGITEPEVRALTRREERATASIKKAEEILGLKKTGTGFVGGEKAVPALDESVQQNISKRISELNKLQRIREIERTKENKEKIISLKADISSIKEVVRKGETFALGMGSAVISNAVALTQLPKTAKKVFNEVKEDPKNIVKIGKRIPDVLKREAGEFVDLYRVSPTEAMGNIAGQIVFFSGTAKVLKVVGKIGKVPAKLVKTALKGKKGTKIKILGTQGAKGNKIITKIIFSKGKRQLGGAIGISVIKKGRVFTQAVGKVGKVGKITKKFKEKGVFVGREVSISKAQRFKLISQLKRIQKVRKLTRTEKGLFVRLRRKKKKIIISKDIEGIIQVGLGRIAQAPGTKLLRTAIRLPTGQLKKIQAKGLKIKDFVSFSAVFTRKDISLIVGKTLTKKKDIIEFIGLIKGTTPKTFISFSASKQKLFSQALKDVVGVATATTKRSRTIIPKLSPKAKSLIVRSTGIAIVKAKVIPRPAPKVLIKQRLILTKKTKQITITQKKISTKQKGLIKQSQVISKKQKVLVKQKPKTKQAQKQLTKQKQTLKQKQKLLTKQRQTTKQKQKLLTKQRQTIRQRQKLLAKQIRVGVPVKVIVPKVKVPVGIIKKKKIKKKIVKPVKIKFIVEIKRFGKWKKIGAFNTLPQARSRGIKRAKRTLGASVRVRKDGKVVKLKTTREFRRSKTDPRILVQKKVKIDRIGSRLGTRAEVMAIKKARQRARRLKRKPVKKSKRRTIKRTPIRRVKKRPMIKQKRRTAMRIPSRKIRRLRRPKTPLKLKKLSRTVIKKAPKGKKPTRWRFKGNRRLGFRNNKVVEIVKFNTRKSSPKKSRRRRPTIRGVKKRFIPSSPIIPLKSIKRKATKRTLSAKQLSNLAKGRKILAEIRRKK